MPIVSGLDIHRKQLTFDYLDTVRGEVKRGQVAPADRAHLRAWLARFAGRDDVAFALEGCTGWRYVAEELAGPASRRMLPSRPVPPSPAAASGTPRPARPTPGTCGSCWPRAGCRSAGSRRRASWSAGRCWRPTTTCAPSTPPGCSASMRCSSTRVRPRWVRARCAPTALSGRCGRPPPRTCPGRLPDRPASSHHGAAEAVIECAPPVAGYRRLARAVPWPATLRVGLDAPRAALTNVAGAVPVPFSGLDLTELVVYLSWTDDVLVVDPPYTCTGDAPDHCHQAARSGCSCGERGARTAD